MGNQTEKDKRASSGPPDRRLSARQLEDPYIRAKHQAPDLDVPELKPPRPKNTHKLAGSNAVTMTIEEPDERGDPKRRPANQPTSASQAIAKPESPSLATAQLSISPGALATSPVAAMSTSLSATVSASVSVATSLAGISARVERIFGSSHTLLVLDSGLRATFQDRIPAEPTMNVEQVIAAFGQINQTGDDLAQSIPPHHPEWTVVHLGADANLFSAYSLGHGMYYLLFFSSKPADLITADLQMESLCKELEAILNIPEEHVDLGIDDY